MKKLSHKIIGSAFILLVFLQLGCEKAENFLDKKSTNSLNEATVFADSARTMDFLGGVYNGLFIWRVSGPSNGSENILAAVTDEASQRYPSAGMLETQILSGSFGGTFNAYINDSWSFLYTHIRRANIFLNNVDNSPLSASLKTRTKLETRFLRTYFYARLMEGWGGVPLMGDTIFDLSSSAEGGRRPYAECVDYVISELDAIAAQLPLTYTGLNYGRITRGAALALKARVLLFAASPLYNGGSAAQDAELKVLTGYPDHDPSRWQKALEACQAVVNLGIYELETDNSTKPGNGFYEVFLKRVNKEYILAYMMGPNVYLEQYNMPPSRGYWDSYHRCPTQELVDAFPMKNGKQIEDPASGYDPDNPYEGRDPRFYYSIIYNGSLYFNRNGRTMQPVWTYEGASPDGIVPISSGGATHTGYYYRKMMDELIPYQGGGNTNRCLPVMRYGGLLLDLAEAANETGNIPLAMEQLTAIRERAGIDAGPDGMYGLPANPAQDEVRELIRRERFIELAFEGYRFFDIRRWKAGDIIDGKYTHGMRIKKDGDNYSYERVELRMHVFKENIYLFPIPFDEVSINRDILQNPGW